MSIQPRVIARAYLDVRARQHRLARARLRERLRDGTDRWRWRAALRSHPLTAVPYRTLVALAGVTLIVAGVPMVPLVGPGWALIIAGLFVLATEFTWARSVSVHVVTEVRTLEHAVKAASRPVKVVLALLSGAFGWLCAYLVLLAVGVPGWVPARVAHVLALLPGVNA